MILERGDPAMPRLITIVQALVEYVRTFDPNDDDVTDSWKIPYLAREHRRISRSSDPDDVGDPMHQPDAVQEPDDQFVVKLHELYQILSYGSVKNKRYLNFGLLGLNPGSLSSCL